METIAYIDNDIKWQLELNIVESHSELSYY